MATYIDTSALCKLLIRETESMALRTWIDQNDPLLVSSELTITELTRSVRVRAPGLANLTNGIIELLAMIPITQDVLHTASNIPPATVRSLDAIHLATVSKLAESLDWVITYDKRMQEAAMSLGFSVVAPS